MSYLSHSHLFSSRPRERRLFRMEDAELERYIEQVATQEAQKTAKLQKDDAAHGVQIRGEMTVDELEAFKRGGHQELAKLQKTKLVDRDRAIVEEYDAIEPADENSVEYRLFHDASSRELGREQQRREEERQKTHAEIKRLLTEIHAMIEPEAAAEKETLDRLARQRLVQSQTLGPPTPEEERVAAALDFHARDGRTLKEKEDIKAEAIDTFVAEAAGEQVTVDGQTFKKGQEVVYTDRKGNTMIMTVEIPEGLAKGSIALTGMRENKKGKLQRLNFAIDREAVRTRISTDTKGFLQKQQTAEVIPFPEKGDGEQAAAA